VTGPASPSRPFRLHRSELSLRIFSGLALALLAIGAAFLGGWPFAVFWSLASLGVLREWSTLVAGPDRWSVLMSGAASLLLALGLVVTWHFLAALIVLAMGTFAAAALAPSERRIWAAGGIPYAGALAIAPIVLRADNDHGFPALIILFAIVWATDIVAYFAGRAVGGPKLMPRVSPNKTWSGAICGTVAAIVAAVAVAQGAGLASLFAIAALAGVLSIFAQAGDLFESFVKRRFGAKDSGHVIPGHGGLMDRLDGFLAASVAATLIGLARGGSEAPGRGLLVW
jgi:phosphatidate cytidylyltransferase